MKIYEDELTHVLKFDPEDRRFQSDYQIKPRFSHFTSKEQYIKAKIKYCEPMTAKEIESEEEQDSLLKDPNYYVEEKFDGTRGILQFLKPNKFDPEKLNLDDNEKYLCYEVLHGSGFTHGKHRIYEYFIQDHTLSEKANFLKYEYGVGGGTRDYENRHAYADHDSRGLVITLDDIMSGEKIKYTWSDVAKFIDWLIQKGVYYPITAYTRCFSRRISVKTDWFSENTDSLPHLRDIEIPELDGTIIDGEMFIPDQPFKAVSSTLNCNWDKAIKRQIELGLIVFHAFDILYYKGVRVEKLPLERRKAYLQLVIDRVNSPFVKMVNYYDDKIHVHLENNQFDSLEKQKDTYPNLYAELEQNDHGFDADVSHRAYYEYIVFNGGEGVIVKPKNGKYYHKRGREYQKIKKFFTREVIVMGFSEPEKEYKGKAPETWQYWETLDKDNDAFCYDGDRQSKFDVPVSKYYFEEWVGNIRYGVIINEEEISKLDKKKKFNIETFGGNGNKVIEVGECGGFDEEMRKYFTDNQSELIGSVIEVKCNELFKDTGRLRHPRFLRMREDKSPLECTWSDHIS